MHHELRHGQRSVGVRLGITTAALERLSLVFRQARAGVNSNDPPEACGVCPMLRLPNNFASYVPEPLHSVAIPDLFETAAVQIADRCPRHATRHHIAVAEDGHPLTRLTVGALFQCAKGQSSDGVSDDGWDNDSLPRGDRRLRRALDVARHLS